MSSCQSCSSHGHVALLGHPDFSICVDNEDSQQYYSQQSIEQTLECVEAEFVSGVRKRSRKRDCLDKMIRILCEATTYGSTALCAFVIERYRINRAGQLGSYLEIEERKSGIWHTSRRQVERVLLYYQLQSEAMGRGKEISKMDRTGCGTSVTTSMSRICALLDRLHIPETLSDPPPQLFFVACVVFSLATGSIWASQSNNKYRRWIIGIGMMIGIVMMLRTEHPFQDGKGYLAWAAIFALATSAIVHHTIVESPRYTLDVLSETRLASERSKEYFVADGSMNEKQSNLAATLAAPGKETTARGDSGK